MLSKVHWTPVNLSGSHKLMGELDTCVQDLAQMQPGTALSIINGKKKQKKIEQNNSGQLILHNVRIETRPTFLDYIQT